VALGKRTNQKVSGWNHGKVRGYVEYKAAAEGIVVVLQNEAFTSQTCPNCGARHKPRGRVYRCPACGFQAHRDHLGQVNILSAHKYGAPGKIAVPSGLKHRMPHNLRLMRRRPDTGQVVIPVAWAQVQEVVESTKCHTDGPYRALHLSDGWCVAGHGMLCPVADRAEADEMIQDLLRKRTRED
jgi:predicted RNA-binding Zn-ribbon protein involved in translation (DUF1610 family)